MPNHADPPAPTPRIPLVDEFPSDPGLAATFDRVRSTMGAVPNLYRTLGIAPEILDAWLAFAWPLRHSAVTDRAIRELLIMRTAQLTAADYEWRQHWSMSIAAGVTEAQLAALSTWPDADPGTFSPEARAALAMVEQIAVVGRLDDSGWETLRRHFDDRGCLELVLTAAFYSCVSRVLNGLAVPLEAHNVDTPPIDPAATIPHLDVNERITDDPA